MKLTHLCYPAALIGAFALSACTSSNNPERDESDEAEGDAAAGEDAAAPSTATETTPTSGDAGASSPSPSDDPAADAGGSETSSEPTDTESEPETQSDGGIPNADASVDGVIDAGAPQIDPADAAVSGEASLTRRFTLLGPETPDEAPAVITPEALVPREAARLMTGCADGGLLVWDGRHLARYTADWELEWEVRTVDGFFTAGVVNIEAMELTPECEALIGGTTTAGLPDQGVTGGADAWSGRVDGSGALVWSDQWGTSGAESTKSFVLLEDGGFLALGVSSGQAPGHPPEVAGGPVIVRYAADGTREWIRQHAPTIGAPFGSEIAFGAAPYYEFRGAGELFHTLQGGLLTTWNTAGDLVDEVPLVGEWADAPYLYQAQLPVSQFHHVAFEPVSGTWVGTPSPNVGCAPAAPPPPVPAPPPGVPEEDLPLTPVYINSLCPGPAALIDLDGTIQWLAATATDEQIIDDVEGVIWTGSFSQVSRVALTEDHIYFAGFYQNSYQNGSIVRPATRPAFVGMYDLDGERIWFREFVLELDPASDMPVPPTAITHLVPNVNGDVEVYFQTGVVSASSWGRATLAFETGDAL